MTSQANDFAFESTVESILLDGGWSQGDREEWDVDRALFAARALASI